MRSRFTTLSNSLTLGIGPTAYAVQRLSFDLVFTHEGVVDAFGAQLAEQFGWRWLRCRTRPPVHTSPTWRPVPAAAQTFSIGVSARTSTEQSMPALIMSSLAAAV